MNVSITVQGMAKVCRGDFPVGKICDGADLNVKRPGKTSILSSSSVLERGGPVVTKRDPSVKIIGTSTALFRRSEYNDIDQSRSTTSIERFHGVRIIRKIIIFP